MTRNEWIQNEIETWRFEGIVSEELAEILRSRYRSAKSGSSFGTCLVGAFGALLFGLGIIAFFAANWDEFNRPVRAVLAITPVVFCAVGAIVAARKRTVSMAVWEPLGIIWCISTGAAACLVAQTYQVGGSVPGFILFVALLSLPVVWLTGSATATAFWPVYAISYSFAAENAEGASFMLLFKSLAFMLLSVPAYVSFLRRNPSLAALSAVQMVTGLVYCIGVPLIVLSSLDNFYSLEHGILYIFWAGSALVWMLGIGFKLLRWPFIAVLVATVTAMFSPFSDNIQFALSILMAFVCTWYGSVKAKLSYMNVGVALLLWLIMAKFFESEVSFTIKSLAFVCAGAVLTVVNVLMLRHKRRKSVK